MLNPLFDAINNIDETIIVNAQKTSKKPILLRVGIIAVAAAAVALTVVIRNFGGTIGNYISPKDSNGVSYVASGFGNSQTSMPNESVSSQNNRYVAEVNGKDYYFNVYPQNIIIPDSFKPDQDEDSHFFYDLKMRPTDVFTKFGISPLMNDNFTDVIEFEPMLCRNNITGDEWYYNGGPNVSVNPSNSIIFEYYLYNKNVNKNVYFTIEYYTGNVDCSGNTSGDAIYMKDGSVGIIGRNKAMFAYNGVMYTVSVNAEYDNNDYINQVLTDLGIL